MVLVAIKCGARSNGFERAGQGKASEGCRLAGASQFLKSGRKFSLAPGFSPVMMVENVGKPF
jgi:hypothetical protein